MNVINVHAAGLDGKSPFNEYDLRDKGVTGVDFRVQGVLVRQWRTVHVLISAVNTIVSKNLREFAFVCSHATHRSVGCCFLLAIFAFPRAKIVLTTRRTMEAARAQGLEVVQLG